MMVSIVTLAKFFLLAVALAMGIMAAVVLTRRRRAPESFLVALTMATAAVYCFGYAMELAQTTLAAAQFWLRVEYVGIPWIPGLWVLLTRRHFGLRTPTVLLMIVPAIVALAEWTNGIHGLYDRSMALVPHGPFWVVAVQRGPLAWLNLAYLYGALLYGALLCLLRLRTTSGLIRVQIVLFATSCLPPLIGYMVYFFGYSPWGLDLAPVTLCFTLILGYVTVFRLECFNVVPMARSLVFKSIRDSVLVADLRCCLVDFNSAANVLFPDISEATLGRGVSTFFPESAGFEQAFRSPDSLHHMTLKLGSEEQQFEVSFFRLGTERQQLGWAVILANITAQVELVQRLQRHAETDSLTEVANRRAFNAAIAREHARARRYLSCFAAMLVDVDHFKAINDREGHAVGDRVLRFVARRISLCLRSTDLLSRYGGDEFAILLPETKLEQAREVADRIRAEVECGASRSGTQTTPVTITIGLSVHMPGDVTDPWQLLEQADKALYSAKSNGRNQVAIWEGLSAPADRKA